MTEPTPTPASSPAALAAPASAPAAAAPSAASPSNPATAGSPTTATTPAASPSQPNKPAYIPDTYWDSKTGKVTDETKFAEWINENVAFKAADDSRRLTLPAKPEDYKADLPADFKAPDGIDVQFKPDDPLLSQARQTAKEMGLTQEQFSKLLSLHAGSLVQQQQTFKTARDAEVAKLGPTATARINAITTWLKAVGGADADTLVKVMDYAPVAGTVKAFENLMTRFASQGAGGFSQSHREPGDNSGRLSEQQFNGMSVADRLDYARRMSNGKAA